MAVALDYTKGHMVPGMLTLPSSVAVRGDMTSRSLREQRCRMLRRD